MMTDVVRYLIWNGEYNYDGDSVANNLGASAGLVTAKKGRWFNFARGGHENTVKAESPIAVKILELQPITQFQQLGAIKVELKAIEKIRSMMVRIYSTNYGDDIGDDDLPDNKWLVYQEILDKDQIDKLPNINVSVDDNNDKIPNPDSEQHFNAYGKGNGYHHLSGPYRVVIWIARLENKFDDYYYENYLNKPTPNPPAKFEENPTEVDGRTIRDTDNTIGKLTLTPTANVDGPNVCFTWLGPPQEATKTVKGIEGKVRPDLFGLLRTANAEFKSTGGPAPRFKLCCLKKYKSEFEEQLPDHIEVFCIEDAFDTGVDENLIDNEPADFTNLGLCVDYITRSILGVRGVDYEKRDLPFKMLAFVKDIWSLYFVWKFGGYHIDCGCFPDPKYGDTVELYNPDTFGVPVISGVGMNFLHANIAFEGGAICASLSGQLNSEAASKMLLDVGVSKREFDSPLDRQVDIWLLRSPAAHPAAEKALKFYVNAWFALRKADPKSEILPDVYRALAISSISTGISHMPTHCCGHATSVNEHLIEANGGDVPSLGLRKVGFQSHA
jgi:hypothetical protein